MSERIVFTRTFDGDPRLAAFLASAGDSLKTFRYFAKRTQEVLQHHAYTILGMRGDVPVSYGHLDREDGKVWLGICVSWSERGKGYGALTMHELVRYADHVGIKWLDLAVDRENRIAQLLYEKFGFERVSEASGLLHYQRAHLGGSEEGGRDDL